MDIDPNMNHFSQIYPDLNSVHKSQYHDFTKFNTINSNSLKDLSLVHINIRSLYHEADHLLALQNQLVVKIDLICFTESWLKKNIKHLINITGYVGFHSLRINRIGGGISMYVKDRFITKRISN